MHCTIRESTIGDGERMIEIWRSSVAATHSFVSPADLAAIDLEVQRFLPDYRASLALNEKEQPVAFMGVVSGSIESLFVAGDQRGRGYGCALVDHAKRGSASLTTIVNEQNDQAMGFFKHVGFAVVGRSPTDEQGRSYPILHLRWDR